MIETIDEIIEALELLMDECNEFILNCSEEEFTHRISDEKWTIADEFSHVLKSVVAVCSGLSRNKILFRAFGKPNREMRTFVETKKRYDERLSAAQGAVAPSTFTAGENEVQDAKAMLEHFNATKGKFRERILNWGDKNLNKYLMPHPLLGKMYVREMLYFTIFHTEHHLNKMKDKLEQLRS